MVSPLDEDPVLKDIPTVEGWKVLPPVVLYAKIGQGGMGAVYRGRHLDFDIDVAVKCLKASLAAEDEQFIARFRREAKLAASLSHENLIRVYDSRRAHGLHYLVMEFVDGETARARVARKGPLDEFEAATIILGASRGLAKAHNHAETVVHRDVKPDNILISRRGEVKLADLGIAKALDHSDVATFNTEGVIGTPQYMAPEQWDRDQALGPQSDVWSFGATLYFLLTGESGIRSGTQKQIYVDVCQKPFPDVKRKRPEISEALSAILDKCLRKDMHERYADAGELAKALEGFIGHRPTTLDDPDTGTACTIALVSPPPSPTMKRIRTQVEHGTGEIVTPATAGTLVVPAEKSRKAWWIGGGILGACALGALAFQLLGGDKGPRKESEPPVAPLDSTPPSFRSAEPDEGDELFTGTPITLTLQFDEPLASATICSKAAKVSGNQAILETVVPNVRQWKIEYDVVDKAGNHVRDSQLRYLCATKAIPKTPRLLPEIAGLVDGTLYLKEDALIVRGRVENPASTKILLVLDGKPTAFELDDDGRMDISQVVPKGKTVQARLEYGELSQAFTVVQDSRDPAIEILKPAGSAVRTRENMVDVEVRVSDDNLLRVELERELEHQPMVDAGNGVFRAAGVVLDADAEHIFDIVAVDKAGNSGGKRLRITRDTVGARLVAIDPRANSALKPGAPVTLELTFKEDLASAMIDGKPAAILDAERNIARLSTNVPPGETPWIVAYDVVDLADNHTRASATFLKTNEPPPPEPRITLNPRPPADGAVVVGVAVMPLRGTIENAGVTAVVLNVAGKPATFTLEKNGDFVANLELPSDSRSKIELSCGTASIVFEVVQDSTAPKITRQSPAADDALTKERALDVRLLVDDPNLANVTIGTREMKGKGSGIWKLDALDLKEGANSFEIVATDSVGHKTTQALAVRRDTTPPKLLPASSDPKANTAYAAGKIVACRFLFDEPIVSVTIGGKRTDATGSEASFVVDVPIASGPWTIEGIAQDIAGNPGSFSLNLAHVPEPEAGGVTSAGFEAGPKPVGPGPTTTPSTGTTTPPPVGTLKQFAGFQSKPEGANALGFPKTIVHVKTGIELVAVQLANDKAPVLYVSRALVTKRQYSGKPKAEETAQVSVGADEVASEWCASSGRGALLDLPTDAEWAQFAAEITKAAGSQVEMLKGPLTSTSWPTRDRDGQAGTQHPAHGSPLSGFRVVYRVR